MKLLEKYLKEITLSDEQKVKKEMNVGAAVVVKKGENGELLALIIQRAKEDAWPNHWEIPRGKCDFGNENKKGEENIRSCTIRECKEEVGLDIIPIKFIDKFSYLADKGTRKSTQYNFLCKLKNPNQKVKLSNEHQDFKWIQTVGEAELYVVPETKKTLSKVLNLGAPLVDYPENKLSDEKITEIVNKYLRVL